MHTGGTGHLRQAADVILDVLGGGHHQVRQLIDDNDDLRHGPKLLPRGGQTVIALQVAGAGGGEHLVAVEHLPDRPAQRAGGLFGVGDDRHQQMRNAVVAAQLHHLGVDHQQLNLLGRGLVQQADDDGIDADRLAAAGGAGDEQVRHFGQIRQADASGDILAQRDRKPAFGVDELLAVDDLPDGDGGDILVGDFDADGSLVGDGRFDTHPAGSQIQGDIIRQIGDAADLDPGGGLQLVPGDGRPAGNIHDAGLHTEAAQGIHQPVGVGAQLPLGVAAAAGLGLLQQVDRREGIDLLLRRRLHQHLLRGLLLRRFAEVQQTVPGFSGRFAHHRAAADRPGDQVLDGGFGGGGRRDRGSRRRRGSRLRHGGHRLVRLGLKIVGTAGIGGDLHGVGQALHLAAGGLSLLGKCLPAGGGRGFFLPLQRHIDIELFAVVFLHRFGGFGRGLTVFHRRGVGFLQLFHRLGRPAEQPDEGGAGGDHKENEKEQDIHDKRAGMAQPAQRVHPEQHGNGPAARQFGTAAVQRPDRFGKAAFDSLSRDDMGDAGQQQYHQNNADGLDARRNAGAVHGDENGDDHEQRADEIAAPAQQAAQHIMYGVPGAGPGDGCKAKQQHPQRKQHDGGQLPAGLLLRLGRLFGGGFALFGGGFFGGSHRGVGSPFPDFPAPKSREAAHPPPAGAGRGKAAVKVALLFCFLFLVADLVAALQMVPQHFAEVRKVFGGKAALGDKHRVLPAEEKEKVPGGLVHIQDGGPGVQSGGAGLCIQNVDAVIVENVAEGVPNEFFVGPDEPAGGVFRQQEGDQNGQHRHDGDEGHLAVDHKIGIDAHDGDQQQQQIEHHAVFVFGIGHKMGQRKVIPALHNGFGSDFNIHCFYVLSKMWEYAPIIA